MYIPLLKLQLLELKWLDFLTVESALNAGGHWLAMPTIYMRKITSAVVGKHA